MDFTGLLVITIVCLISGPMIQVTFSQPIIYNGNTSYGKGIEDASNSTGVPRPQNASTLSKDASLPIVKIVDPNWCSAVYGQRNILVNGSSSDDGTGVQVVEVRVDKNKYSTAIPDKPGNWSTWSLPMELNDTKPHRILARATDYKGNKNWDDITINSPLSNRSAPAAEPLVQGKKTRFAFVEPSFTNAAYGERFYKFYAKYDNVTPGQKVTTDLDFLTANVPLERDRDYFRNFTEHVKRHAPDSTVSVVRDEDLHDGYIFRPDGSNAYDVLFFLHDEYITQQGYDNLRDFVTHGGTVIFLDGNVFYAQVHYDPRECTSTLVRGHDWQFDGKAAVKSVHERYFDENKQFVGSNFLYGDIAEPVHFIDNPFNYTHFEENYVNNPNATILFDYGAQIPQTVLNDNPEAA
ncbi:MAG TPA: N,N-dimethylformamidase beta subunit family domain-containing protein, partial [Nitrososphaeraceae archaeon]